MIGCEVWNLDLVHRATRISLTAGGLTLASLGKYSSLGPICRASGPMFAIILTDKIYTETGKG